MPSWDDGQHWDEGLFWDSASPPPLPTAFNHKRKSTMKRQPFFPRIIAARPDWFGNFAAQILIANATLGLPAGDVTAIVGPEDAAEHDVPEFSLKLLTGAECICAAPSGLADIHGE